MSVWDAFTDALNTEFGFDPDDDDEEHARKCERVLIATVRAIAADALEGTGTIWLGLT